MRGRWCWGGWLAAVTGLALAQVPPTLGLLAMALAGMVTGGLWIMLIGALRHFRGVNETISSLLLNYVAIAFLSHMVEGPWRDPSSLNQPSSLLATDRPQPGQLSRLPHSLGLAVRAAGLRDRPCFDSAHHLWICRAHGGRQPARGPHGRAFAGKTHPGDLFLGGLLCRAGGHGGGGGSPKVGPAAPCTLTTATPVFWWPLWPNKVRWRWCWCRCCWAAFWLAAVCCSGLTTCPMPRCMVFQGLIFSGRSL